MTAARRTTIELMQFAEAIPAIDDLALDFEGRLWVERRGLPGEEGSIDIVTPDARYLGTIQPGGLRIPDAFGPDGLMAYGETHDLGFPIVRVVRLTPAVPLEAGSSTGNP